MHRKTAVLCTHAVTTRILRCCLCVHGFYAKIKISSGGTVRLVFQPGEETTGGALPMINEGILENPKVDAAFAYHVTNEAPTGSVIVKKAALWHRRTILYITVKGIGGSRRTT